MVYYLWDYAPIHYYVCGHQIIVLEIFSLIKYFKNEQILFDLSGLAMPFRYEL